MNKEKKTPKPRGMPKNEGGKTGSQALSQEYISGCWYVPDHVHLYLWDIC